MRALLTMLALATATVAQAAPAPITGRWLTLEGKAIVVVTPCGQALCGRIAKVLKPRPGGPAIDTNNPDPTQRNRPIEGLVILSGFTADDDRWEGKIYDPESGRTYRSELKAEGNVLKVKGCWGPFCRSQDWTRLN